MVCQTCLHSWVRKTPKTSLHVYLYADALKPHSSPTHPLQECCPPSSQRLPPALLPALLLAFLPKLADTEQPHQHLRCHFPLPPLVFAQDFLV